MADLRNKQNIIRIAEFLVAALIAALIVDTICFGCNAYYVENQFIDATAYGIFLIATIIFVSILLNEKIGQKTGYIIAVVAALMYVTTGILLFIEADKLRDIPMYNRHEYGRLVAAGVFSLINFIIYTIEFFLSIFKKDLIEGDI